jgi:hypothetical protein
VTRINREDLPVNLLGSLKSPRLIMLGGNREGFGKRCHSVHFGNEPCVPATKFLFGAG